MSNYLPLLIGIEYLAKCFDLFGKGNVYEQCPISWCDLAVTLSKITLGLLRGNFSFCMVLPRPSLKGAWRALFLCPEASFPLSGWSCRKGQPGDETVLTASMCWEGRPRCRFGKRNSDLPRECCVILRKAFPTLKLKYLPLYFFTLNYITL